MMAPLCESNKAQIKNTPLLDHFIFCYQLHICKNLGAIFLNDGATDYHLLIDYLHKVFHNIYKNARIIMF